MGFEPLAPSGEALGFQFPLNCGWLCWKKGLWRDCVPASPIPFDVGLLSFFQTCRNHAVVSLFFFFPRESCCICSCRFGVFVFVGEGGFRILFWAYLDPELTFVLRN